MLRLAVTLIMAFCLTSQAMAADLLSFWDTPRHGGNSFNRLPPDQAYFDALKTTARHGSGSPTTNGNLRGGIFCLVMRITMTA